MHLGIGIGNIYPVVILAQKYRKLRLRLECLKSNGICVNMSYAFIWSGAVFYCRVAVSAGWGKTVLQTARLIQSDTL